MSMTEHLLDSLRQQANIASAYLDEESDETRENAVAILDEWSYGELDDCQVLLTDFLNDNLESVTDDVLWARFDGIVFTEGTYSWHKMLSCAND